VIGVTTSLAPAVMEAAAPDLIHGGPQDISIADILGLKLRQQAQQQAQQAQQQVWAEVFVRVAGWLRSVLQSFCMRMSVVPLR